MDAISVNADPTEQVTEQVGRVRSAMDAKPMPIAELMLVLGLAHRPTFLYTYLPPALAAGLIEMTLPGKPRSSKQRYRLTAKGKSWLPSQSAARA